MTTTNDVTIEYTSKLTPQNPTETNTLLTQIENTTAAIYEERQTRVTNNTPLLATVDKPYYEVTPLDTHLAYSIDCRNIHKWFKHFLADTETAPQTPDTITLDIPVSNYTYDATTETVTVETETANHTFKLESSPPFNFEDAQTTLFFQYTPSEDYLYLSFEEDAVTQADAGLYHTPEQDFTTAYDAYHNTLTADTNETHEPFAIYSPSVSFEDAQDYATETTPDASVIVTNDGWKVCVKTPEDKDFIPDVSIVELLNPVSGDIVSYYENFPYPESYIHLPELQFLHTTPNYLSDHEEHQLRVLPYAVPYGNTELLVEKLQHAQRFIADASDDQPLLNELRYEQFFETQTTSL